MWETLMFPEPAVASRYHEQGWWRAGTPLDDLAAVVARTPERDAVIAYRNGLLDRRLTWAQLDTMVTRFAAAMVELGVDRDDVVMLYLPNWWMLLPLHLACQKVGAVAFSFMPAFGGRELGQALRISGAKVCVTADRYEGMAMAATLAEVAPPTLRHQVVVGAGPDEAGKTVDFTNFFVDTPWEQRHEISPLARRAADEVAVLLFTSGTTGQPKCIAHTSNTLYASMRSIAVPYGLDTGEIITIPHYLTHMAGCSLSIYMSITLGGTCVMQDDRDMGLLLDMVEAHRITFAYAAPMFVELMIEAQDKQARDISSLRTLVSGSSPLPPAMIATARTVLGVELYALWGMTENGGVTVTRPDDPPGWAAHSDGRCEPWMQTRIAYGPDAVTSSGQSPFGRLLVRGASQCLGYLNVSQAYRACLDEDGWFDTGDLARDDGRGGIRITGRRTDLIIRRNAIKVPSVEVEGVLTTHPRVVDVALIGYPDPDMPQTELVCAFVVADGEPPTLAELRAYLEDQQMTSFNWPDRIEVVSGLPKNSLGKVRREQLRDRIADQS